MLGDEQVVLQLGDVAHVDEVAVVLELVLVAAVLQPGHLREQAVEAIDIGNCFAGPVAEGAAGFTGEADHAFRVDQIHSAVKALLVGVDQLDHAFHGQADAGNAEKMLCLVEHPVVDEDGHAVLVGHVDVDIDLVGLFQLADTEVPGVTGLILGHLLEDAAALEVGTGLFRNEEAGEGVVAVLYLAQIAGDLPDVLLTVFDPVVQEGVVGHHRGDQHRAHQVALDFRVDVVRGQRQFGAEDAAAYRFQRGVVTEEGGGEESAQQQKQQQQAQWPEGPVAATGQRHAERSKAR